MGGKRPGHLNRVAGLVVGAPHLACAILGCWLTDPLNNLFGRRGTIWISCFIAAVASIWEGVANSWSTFSSHVSSLIWELVANRLLFLSTQPNVRQHQFEVRRSRLDSIPPTQKYEPQDIFPECTPIRHIQNRHVLHGYILSLISSLGKGILNDTSSQRPS